MLTRKARVSLAVSRVLQATFLPPQQLDRISSRYLPRWKKVASELRRGQPVQGHLDGGRACLLAMRVSRSVLLSVCEAVIRFQDFPSVTGLLTKPYTLLHEDNRHNVTPPPLPTPHHHHHQPLPNPWAAAAATPLAGRSHTVTCSPTQNLPTPTEKNLDPTNFSVPGVKCEIKVHE